MSGEIINSRYISSHFHLKMNFNSFFLLCSGNQQKHINSSRQRSILSSKANNDEKLFSSQQNAYIWRKHINFYASQTREKNEDRRGGIASFVMMQEKTSSSIKERKEKVCLRRKGKNPQRNSFIEKTFFGWFTI